MTLITIKIPKLTESMKEDVLQATKEHVDFPKFRANGTDRQNGSRAKTVRESKSKPLCFTATAQKPDGLSHCLTNYSSSGR